MCANQGLLPFHISLGVMKSNTHSRTLILRVNRINHHFLPKTIWWGFEHVLWHFHNGSITCSATPFCWGIYKVDVCFSMPWSFKNWLIALQTNPPPLFKWNILMWCFDCVSARALNPLRTFFSWISTHTTTISLTKYLTPSMNVVNMGPHTSEWTISKGLVDRLHPLFRNAILCCLSSIQAKQQTRGIKIYHSACFGVYEYFSYLNGQGGSAKMWARHPVGDCTKLATSYTSQNLFPTSCIHVAQLQWLHCCKILQCIHLGWIGPLIRLTQIYSPRANWHAIGARDAHLWYKYGWFFFSRLPPQW